jgi:hypothetical protein
MRPSLSGRAFFRRARGVPSCPVWDSMACAGQQQNDTGVRFVGNGSKILQMGETGWDQAREPLYDERGLSTFAFVREQRRPPIMYNLPSKEGRC